MYVNISIMLKFVSGQFTAARGRGCSDNALIIQLYCTTNDQTVGSNLTLGRVCGLFSYVVVLKTYVTGVNG